MAVKRYFLADDQLRQGNDNDNDNKMCTAQAVTEYLARYCVAVQVNNVQTCNFVENT